jgi:hypothetical protein
MGAGSFTLLNTAEVKNLRSVPTFYFCPFFSETIRTVEGRGLDPVSRRSMRGLHPGNFFHGPCGYIGFAGGDFHPGNGED